MTKIVALSDTHGRHRRLDVPEGDILIVAGDITGGGVRLEDVADWLDELDHPHKFVVAGNCDGTIERDPDAARRVLSSATYLQDEAVEAEGLKIYGSPWQPVFLNMAFNLPRGEPLAKKWASIPEDTDVLVTHGPPHGVLDETSRGERVGDRALATRVTDVRPGLHIFGHIHESRGTDRRDDTLFVNAACNSSGRNPFVLEMQQDQWRVANSPQH